MKGKVTFKGGKGSGDWGHSGRPGKVGGSGGGVGRGEVGTNDLGYSIIFTKYGSYGTIELGSNVSVQNAGKKDGIYVIQYGEVKRKFKQIEGMKALRYAERLRVAESKRIEDKMRSFDLTPGEDRGATLADILAGGDD